ncbi:signal peptide peptidase SppA [Microbulbifer sp. CAU 1566]|uniref:signal peptide peptidase SppA n=1 Tax=Microbulbifer sp. CAU 1566 TaxID=2933269 RepID=UPI002004B7F2|nr:signal peptide peptidase SppA [Microbulbifer sp. CAU 1566]MCK7595762.1 signal peptide peptidase SppA [Microbulbifer sp. CAU 1566]
MTEATRHRGPVRRFFGAIGGAITWLRRVFTNLLFLLLLLFIGIVIFGGEERITVPQGAALKVAPGGALVDELSQPTGIPVFLGGRATPPETRVKDLVDAIDRAADDNRITALVMELDHLGGASLSKLEEVGEAVQRFKASDKPVYAIGDNFTQGQYFLASYADKVYLNPMGSLLLTGFGSYRNYYKSALEKLKVNFHVFRVGDYKDFIEPYTRDDMSPASRENNARWLHQLWTEYTEQVTGLRNLPPNAVDSYIAELPQKLRAEGGSWAEAALANKFVDKLLTRRAAVAELQELVGASDADKSLYNAINALDYLRHMKLTNLPDPRLQRDKIGLISAAGAIVDGEAPAGQIGSTTLSQLIAKAREKNIKALVLRVDSPGGSAFASEAIRQELLATREAGIPVIISMGSVAASGGYWIAAGGDKIWASPSTITGSIGVFGAFPTFEDSLEHLGVYNDGVGTTELAGTMRLDRALPEAAADILQQGVENTYSKFLRLVAEARSSTPEEVHKIAQGQVWTGRAALDLGLVDDLGNLKDAIADAAQIAQLDNFEVLEIQRELSPSEKLMRALADNVDARIAASVEQNLPLGAWFSSLQPALQPLQELKSFKDPRALYVRCVSCVAP